jgi:iron transport multicopper oxidase
MGLAAQRYSFILNANQKIDNYWVRAQPTLPGSNQGFVNGTNSAILRYANARIADPTTNSTSTKPLVETDLHPLIKTRVPGLPHPGGADVVLNLQITLNLTDFRFAINNVVCRMAFCSKGKMTDCINCFAELRPPNYTGAPPDPIWRTPCARIASKGQRL